MTIDTTRLIYLHGLESSSQSGKARLFAQKYPGMLTPDFSGSFDERMAQLSPILGHKSGWTIIGSSFGGLMGSAFTCAHPDQVKKLILLAPALMLPEFTNPHFPPVEVPTVLIHGTQDDVVPAEEVMKIAQAIFINLEYIPVDDGHRLHLAFEQLNWDGIIA